VSEAASGDTIYVAGTIDDTVTIEDLSLTISQWPGQAQAVLDGTDSGTVVTVDSGTVQLDQLTLENGSLVGAGGGIANGGTLTVTDSTVTDNTAGFGGGIANHGQLTLVDSTVSDNAATTTAGGIFNNGTATLQGSTVSANTSPDALSVGGIQDGGRTTVAQTDKGGHLTLTDSTVSGNTAGDDGVGGIYVPPSTAPPSRLTLTDSTISDNTGSGLGAGGLVLGGGPDTITGSTISGNIGDNGGAGGLLSDPTTGSLVVTDSTIADNVANGGGAGGITNGGALTLIASTISGNAADNGSGGGLYNSASPTAVGATIIAGNTGGDCAGGQVTSVGYNLTDAAGNACGFDRPTDVVNADPGLGPLANNGGTTETMVPSGSGDAVDHIPLQTTLADEPVCPGNDQRGVARPQPPGGKTCTIGAVEVHPLIVTPTVSVSPPTLVYGSETAAPFTVTVTGIPGDGYPEGTVQIERSGTTATLCTAALTAGSATTHAATYRCALSARQLGVGSYNVKAVYTPATPSSSDAGYTYRGATSSAVTTSIAASQGTPGAVLTLTQGTVADGQESAETFTVVVSGMTGDGRPQGTVTVEDSGTTAIVCSATVAPGTETTDAATYGCALTASQLGVGTYDVKAVYTPATPSSSNPGHDYLATTSPVVTFSVTGTLSSGKSVAQTPTGKGWWVVTATGQVTPYGAAGTYGTMTGRPLNAPIVGISAAVTGKGYWLVAADGGVFSFGAASFHGSLGGQHLNQPVVGMATDQATGGYWLVAADGGVFSFTAPFLGSMGGSQLNQPVVGIAALPTGTGYWVAAADGGVFSFGDASFHGSTGGLHLDEPVVAIANDPVTGGYWLVATDGGVFSFAAPFYGSEGAAPSASPAAGLVVTPGGGGYTIVTPAGSGQHFGP